MRKVKLDNDDLIQYLNTIKALKKYPTMSEYRDEYRRLRTNGSPLIEAKEFKSAHTNLLRLDRKKKSLLENLLKNLILLAMHRLLHPRALRRFRNPYSTEKLYWKKHLMNSSLSS